MLAAHPTGLGVGKRCDLDCSLPMFWVGSRRCRLSRMAVSGRVMGLGEDSVFVEVRGLKPQHEVKQNCYTLSSVCNVVATYLLVVCSDLLRSGGEKTLSKEQKQRK